ncbi:hypothetical protein ACS0TY_011637 [Phlomoides rotata]
MEEKLVRAADTFSEFGILFTNLVMSSYGPLFSEKQRLESLLLQEQVKSTSLVAGHEQVVKDSKNWQSQAKVMAAELRITKNKLEQQEVEYLTAGISCCVNSLFLSPAGHKFLKTLHESWLDAYRRSTSYLGDLGEFVPHFIDIRFDAAVSQHEDPFIRWEVRQGCPSPELDHPSSRRLSPHVPLSDTP